MRKKFKCICGTHLLEIDYSNIIEFKNKKGQTLKEKMSELWIGVYDVYNPNTGKKYKKPKLIADTIFYDKELDFLIKFLSKIELVYLTRK